MKKKLFPLIISAISLANASPTNEFPNNQYGRHTNSKRCQFGTMPIKWENEIPELRQGFQFFDFQTNSSFRHGNPIGILMDFRQIPISTATLHMRNVSHDLLVYQYDANKRRFGEPVLMNTGTNRQYSFDIVGKPYLLEVAVPDGYGKTPAPTHLAQIQCF